MTTPLIPHGELIRRLEPLRPLLERYIAGEAVAEEEWEQAHGR
jgi:hypothetical protein